MSRARRAARFDAELVEGHKGVVVAIVPGAIARAIQQSKQTTQPSKPRADVLL